MQNIGGQRGANTGDEVGVYNVAVDSGIHNVGFEFYDERLPSSRHSNNNKRFSGKFGQCFSLGGRATSVACKKSALIHFNDTKHQSLLCFLDFSKSCVLHRVFCKHGSSSVLTSWDRKQWGRGKLGQGIYKKCKAGPLGTAA